MTRLYIKGTEADAITAATRYGIPITVDKEIRNVIRSKTGCKEVNITTIAKTPCTDARLNRWMSEDTNTPFPQGSLLFWS